MLLWSLVVAVQTSERAGRELAGSPTAMPGSGYRDRDRERERERENEVWGHASRGLGSWCLNYDDFRTFALRGCWNLVCKSITHV